MAVYRLNFYFKVKRANVETLKLYAQDSRKRELFVSALRELRKRNEDISGSKAIILNLMISEKKHDRKQGVIYLDIFFPKTSKEIELNWVVPRREQINKIKEMLAG